MKPDLQRLDDLHSYLVASEEARDEFLRQPSAVCSRMALELPEGAVFPCRNREELEGNLESISKLRLEAETLRKIGGSDPADARPPECEYISWWGSRLICI